MHAESHTCFLVQAGTVLGSIAVIALVVLRHVRRRVRRMTNLTTRLESLSVEPEPFSTAMVSYAAPPTPCLRACIRKHYCLSCG